MNFGDKIKEIRIQKKISLRNLKFKLLNLEKYSKIERNIQKPKNKKEFIEIINSLNIIDENEIKKLESLVFSSVNKKPDKLEIHPELYNLSKEEIDKINDYLEKSNKPI